MTHDFEIFFGGGGDIGDVGEEDADLAEGLGEEDKSFSLDVEFADIFEDATTSLGVDEIDTNLNILQVFRYLDRLYETRIFETKEGILNEFEKGIWFLEVDASAWGDNLPVFVERDEWDLFRRFVFTSWESELFDGGNTFLTEIGLEDFSRDIIHKVGGLEILFEMFEFFLSFFYEVFFFQFYPREDISEVIGTSTHIDPRIDEFEQRSRKSDDEIDDDDDAHERVESGFGRRKTHEEDYRNEWGDEESDETPVHSEEDVAIIGEDLA